MTNLTHSQAVLRSEVDKHLVLLDAWPMTNMAVVMQIAARAISPLAFNL